MISKFPDVRFVLNHFGTPLHVGTNEAVWADWQRDIKLVAAASPNVYAKLSGLMAMLDLGFGMHKETWPNAGPSAEQIAQSRFGEMIRQTVKAFGVDRCFFGSNCGLRTSEASSGNLSNRRLSFDLVPVDKGMARYGELTAAFVIVLKEMGTSKEDMKKMFYSNAKRFYRI
jgi:predicted TIM-barrel fold metal-dependent hydrolase